MIIFILQGRYPKQAGTKEFAMIDDLLSLRTPAGNGQANNPDDIEALDTSLRRIGAYEPPPEYADVPQRYATAPMTAALERFQEQRAQN